MQVTKSKAGWIVDITHTRNGLLEQGGISGRRVLYTHSQLAHLGLSADTDPHAAINSHGTTAIQSLMFAMPPARVLRKGHVIR